MNVLEELICKRWIIKKENPALYNQIRDEIKKYSSFITEKLGYQITKNNYLIKLNKLPGVPQQWMGIQSFKRKEDYAILCVVLMFLEEKMPEEQFVLSSLIEYVSDFYVGDKLDFTNKANRYMIIRVIRFCIENGMIIKNDGNEEDYEKDVNADILYENTGVSKYFTKYFKGDISNFKTAKDFLDDADDRAEDRGERRRHRVYRRLMFDIGVYSDTGDDDDFAYIKNFRNNIKNDFESYFNCDLHVNKTSAYLIMGQEESFGRSFPDNKDISTVLLMVNSIIREKVDKRLITTENNENIILTLYEFEDIIKECRNKYINSFGKGLRDITDTEFVNIVIDSMKYYNLIEIDEYLMRAIIKPVVGKFIGRFPDDYDYSTGKAKAVISENYIDSNEQTNIEEVADDDELLDYE